MRWVAIHGLASLALLAASVFASAQPTPDLGVEDEAEVGVDERGEITAAPARGDETSEERLDRLHGALAIEADPKKAEEIVGRIQALWAKSGSDSMDLLLGRARAAMQEEDFDRARAHLAALTRLAPDFAEAWNASATLRYLQKDYARSAAEIARVLAIEPRHFSALTGLALIFEQTKRDQAAMKTWREVEKLYPAFEKAQKAIERLAPEVDGRQL